MSRVVRLGSRSLLLESSTADLFLLFVELVPLCVLIMSGDATSDEDRAVLCGATLAWWLW